MYVAARAVYCGYRLRREVAVDGQATFDRVSTHLLAQGRRAVGPISTVTCQVVEGCRYRTVEGLSCAVGCLIPDDRYSERLENVQAADLLDSGVLDGVVDQPDEAELLLTSLQSVHDYQGNWRTPATLADALRLVATSHGLDPTVLSTAPFRDPWPATGLSYR